MWILNGSEVPDNATISRFQEKTGDGSLSLIVNDVAAFGG